MHTIYGLMANKIFPLLHVTDPSLNWDQHGLWLRQAKALLLLPSHRSEDNALYQVFMTIHSSMECCVNCHLRIGYGSWVSAQWKGFHTQRDLWHRCDPINLCYLSQAISRLSLRHLEKQASTILKWEWPSDLSPPPSPPT